MSGLGRPAGEWRHSPLAKLIKTHDKPSLGLAAMGGSQPSQDHPRASGMPAMFSFD